MKHVFCILLFLPHIIFAQSSAANIVYSKSFEGKDSNCTVSMEEAQHFIKNHRAAFFHLRSYSKHKLDKDIDTGTYGHINVTDSNLNIKCEWVYQGSGSNGTVLFRGDIVFSCSGHKTNMTLQHLRYYKYIEEAGKAILKNEGGYEELDMCKYCNASGMRIGEFVHDNFLHIATAYERYIKKK